MLDVSRIISGKMRLNVRSIDLPEIVQAAVDSITPAADAKGVRVETMLDPRASPISGDPDRLQQVLWNVASNAVKFTNRGGRIQVRLERVNSHVEITVSDTGIGIPPEFLPLAETLVKKDFPKRMDEYEDLLLENEIIVARSRGVGALSMISAMRSRVKRQT